MSTGNRIALVHEWLNQRHGSEKTFEKIANVFPDADLYALTYNRSSGLEFDGRPVATTFLDRLGPLRSRRDLLLPLMPLAWRLATSRRYDVVVTSSHACAKGFRPGRTALHLCYCYTPMRYIWLPEVDKRRKQGLAERAARGALRRWDLSSVPWVDEFAAISTAVKERIERIYHRDARIIHPPVDTGFYTPPAPGTERRGAVAVSRLVPYKRVDLAIEACREAGVPLTVAGAGPAESELRDLAARAGAEVRFVIEPSDQELLELYRSAAVCVFPAEEDFGIVAVEAQACGTPVVALGRGGSLDTVVNGVTGVCIAEQTVGEVANGVTAVLDGKFSEEACRRHAGRFSAGRFRRELYDWVAGAAARAGIEIAAAPARNPFREPS